MLRLAIAGVGWAGNRQAHAAREIPHQVTVTALIDSDAAHLAAQAAELDIVTTYTDYAAALADPAIDAVSICTPHALHCPMSLAAAEAGKHVLVEKPMAQTVADATRMMAAADAQGIALYVAENEPYTPLSCFLRDFVAAGEEIGALTHVTAAAGFRAQNFGYPGRRAWLTQPDQGGTGTWMLQGIHTVAQLRYILAPVAGEVTTVYLREHKTASFQRRELEGTVSGLLTFESGLHVSLLQSSETRLPPGFKGYVLHGEKGTLRAGADEAELFGNDAGDTPRTLSYPADNRSAYAHELAAFAEYIHAGPAARQDPVRFPTTAQSERRSLAVVQAGYEAMQSGEPVHLPSRFGDL